MWTFTTTMLFYSTMQNSSKTRKEGDKKLTKWRQSISSKTMLEVSSLSTNTSSKSFAPLIKPCRQSTVQGRTKLQSASAEVRRWCGFSSGIHHADAWQPRSRNQLDWDLDCLEATNLEKWSLVFLDAEPPQFHVHDVQVRPWTVTLVLGLQGHVATKLSYCEKFSILVMSHFFLIPTSKEFKNRQTFAKVTVIKVAQFFYSQCAS